MKRCEDCGAKLDLSTQSVLPAYCKRCFAAEAALSRAGKLDNSRDACVLCAGKINADNKSPVPCCCFICYEQQSQVEDAIVAAGAAPVDQQAEDKVVADTDSSAEQKEVVVASLDGQRSDALECMPPGGGKESRRKASKIGLLAFKDTATARRPARKRSTESNESLLTMLIVSVFAEKLQL